MAKRNFQITNKIEWFAAIAELIDDDLENFIVNFYSDFNFKHQGKSIVFEPCPMCGHNDCASSTPREGTHCFSCGWKGSIISAYIKYAEAFKSQDYFSVIKSLGKFYSVEFPFNWTDEDAANYEKQQRTQEILKTAEDFYHTKLMNKNTTVQYHGSEMKVKDYLIEVRGRKESTIKDFKIGYSVDYYELKSKLLEAEFTDEEISNSKIPTNLQHGLLLYFYHHPITKEITRINSKNPFGVNIKYQDESGKWVEGDTVLTGWSSGYKIPYFPPKFSFKKDVVLVEGENDVQAIIEKDFSNVVALGGNIKAESLSVLSQCQGVLYVMADNDHKAAEYIDLINDAFPDKKVAVIKYDKSYNDPDEYYKNADAPYPMADLIKDAEFLTTDKYKITNDYRTWTIKDREKSLEFIMKSASEKGQFIGQANLYDAKGNIKQRVDDTSLVKCRGKFSPFSFHLQDYIDSYFNSGLEKLSFDEVAKRYYYSSRKKDIIDLLARTLYEEGDSKADELVTRLKRILKNVPGSEKTIDLILIEYGNIKNDNVVKDGDIIPKMKISQFYNVKNRDAYFYFTYRKDDGDAKRAIPYLIKNDRSLIRLDLIKRKDNQCLLLVDNKYELPTEVPTSVIDNIHCSLQDTFVEDFRSGALDEDPDFLNPRSIIREIESWIRRFHYSRDENIYKVLALWMYGTYFYTMFSQYPYLFINGEKGSGKTALNNVITMFAFNAKLIVDTSDASLFRTASMEGGTIVLDEQETLTSRSSSVKTPIGSILKGGYSSGSYISRFNTEKNINEMFDPFCPKVISNIFGLEDIILDRCLPISTYKMSISKDTIIEDPKYFIDNDQGPYKEISSRCCFSALNNFEKLNDIYRDKNNVFESENARLSQILTPISSIAKFVDSYEVDGKKSFTSAPSGTIKGEFEMAFMEYFKSTIQFYKNDIEGGTPEGIIRKVVESVAKELYSNDGSAPRDYTIMGGRKYTESIPFSIEEGWFEINTVHFKCFIEENMPGEQVFSRNIPKWLKTCYKFSEGDYKRKYVKLDNEDLIKEFRGTSRPKVMSYKFYFRDFITSDFLEKKEPENIENKEVF